MMRRWISLFAILGVLLHAGAIVRHNATMLAAELPSQSATELGPICHGGRDVAQLPGEPVDQQPSAPRSDCPLCSGLAGVHVLAAPDLTFAAWTCEWTAVPYALAELRLAALPRTDHPPSRGPPLQV